MDRIHFNFEEWSSLVDRYMGHLFNFSTLLPLLHDLIDSLAKKNQSIKPARENQNRLSMTTLVESMMICLTSQDKNFDETGKHVLEDKLSLVTPRSSQMARKDRPETRDHQAAIDISSMTSSPLKAMEVYCDSQRSAVKVSQSKVGNKDDETAQRCADVGSRAKRNIVESVKPELISDPSLNFMRDKK